MAGGVRKSSRSGSSSGNRNASNKPDNKLGTPAALKPETVKCGICKEVVDTDKEKVLRCERCLTCFCIECTGVEEAEHAILTKPNYHWFCDTCNFPAIQAVLTDKAVEDRCKEFLASFEDRLIAVEQEQKSQKEELKQVQRKLETIGQEKNAQAGHGDVEASRQKIEQIEERISRQKNVIIYGLQDSKSNLKEEVRREDANTVKEIFKQVTNADLQDEDFVAV